MYNQYFKPFPVIAAPRVTLRRINKGDLEPLYEVCGDESSCRYSDWYAHIDKNDTAAFIRYLNKNYRQNRLFTFGIIENTQNRLIGTISVVSINPAYTVAEIGYTLAKNYRGRGYAGESVRALCNYLIKVIGVKRIEAKTLPENEASRKLLKTCGFKQEALLVNGAVIRGQVRDCCLYSYIPCNQE